MNLFKILNVNDCKLMFPLCLFKILNNFNPLFISVLAFLNVNDCKLMFPLCYYPLYESFRGAIYLSRRKTKHNPQHFPPRFRTNASFTIKSCFQNREVESCVSRI